MKTPKITVKKQKSTGQKIQHSVKRIRQAVAARQIPRQTLLITGIVIALLIVLTVIAALLANYRTTGKINYTQYQLTDEEDIDEYTASSSYPSVNQDSEVSDFVLSHKLVATRGIVFTPDLAPRIKFSEIDGCKKYMLTGNNLTIETGSCPDINLKNDLTDNLEFISTNGIYKFSGFTEGNYLYLHYDQNGKTAARIYAKTGPGLTLDEAKADAEILIKNISSISL